jgi:hypothetical protein
MHRLLLVVLAICVVTAASCSGRVSRPQPVDSPLVLTLQENLSPSGRSLEIHAATTREYPCLGYSLQYHLERQRGSVAITFAGVSVPQTCATALGPARAVIPLGATAEGVYPLVLTTNDVTLTASLVVTRDSIEVRDGGGRWISFPRPVLHRVPPGTIWGLAGWARPTQERRFTAYLDSLRHLGAHPERLLPGDYGTFTIGWNGEIVTRDGHGYYFAREYLLHYTGDRAPLPGIVRTFGDSLDVTLRDDLGRQWLSWVAPPK